MRNALRRVAALGLLPVLATLAGCGEESIGAGFGDIVLTEINLDGTAGPGGTTPVTPGVPDVFPTVPTEFALSGTDFATVIGNQVTVRFYASRSAAAYVPGPLIFLGGTSGTVDVVGTVFSNTLIGGVTPPAVICGDTNGDGVVTAADSQVPVFVEVILLSGVRDDSTAGPTFVATFSAPVINGVVNAAGNNCIPSLTPIPLTVNGSGFGADGDVVNIVFTSTELNGGVFDPIFADGTTHTISVPGTVGGGGTTIALQSPRATNQVEANPVAIYAVSDPSEDANVQILLANGSCSFAGANSAVVFNRPEVNRAISLSGAYPAPVAPSTQTFAPQQFPTQIVLTGFDDTAPACADQFAPIGGRVHVLLAAPGGPAFAPNNAFQLDNNPDPMLRAGTANLQIVEGTILSGTEIRFATPEIDAVNAPFNFNPFISIEFEDGTIIPVELRAGQNDSVFTWQARPLVTDVTNVDAATGNGFLSVTPVGFFRSDLGSTMRVTGENFTRLADFFPGAEAVVQFYEAGRGLDASGHPALRYGTANPFLGANGNDLGAVYAVTDAAAGGALGDRIEGETRIEPGLVDLDEDEQTFNGTPLGDIAERNGLLSSNVRVINEDGQFRDFRSDGATLLGTSVRADGSNFSNFGDVNLTADGNSNQHASVAIDPTSLGNDFGVSFGGGEVPALNGMNIAVVTGNDPTNLAFAEGESLLLYVSRDGGATFALVNTIDAGEDGFANPGTLRNFGQVAFDRFGTLWVTYLVDDPVGGVSFVAVAGSTDLGNTFALTGFMALPQAFGTIDRPSSVIGPDGANLGQDVLLSSWVDNSGPNPVVVASALQLTGLGGVGIQTIPPVQVNAFPPNTLLLDHARCAIGPNGEVHVVWNDRTSFIFGAFQTFLVSNSDQDGLFGATFGFDGTNDHFVDFIQSQAVPRPASPDDGPQIPLASVAVIPVGANAGRVVVAYDTLVPNAVIGQPDHTRVVSRFSDDLGFTWSASSTLHQADTADQFGAALGADPRTGRLYATWYDTRLDPTSVTTNRFGAASDDGETWGQSVRLSDTASAADGGALAPFEVNDYGFWHGVAALGGNVVTVWAGNEAAPGSLTRMDTFIQLYQQKP